MYFPKLGTKPGRFELTEVGEKFGPITYPVDDWQIKLYAFMEDDYNPWYFTDDNPFGKRIAHASLLANNMLQLFLTEYDPQTIVGLHIEEELWFCNPLFANETITIQGEYVEKFEKRGRGCITMAATATAEDGRIILKRRGTEIMHILATEIKKDGKKAEVKGEAVTGEYDESIPFAEKASFDLKPGTAIRPLQKVLTAEQAQVFSGVGFHFNNIHTNLQTALDSGYPDLVVQGEQQVGCLTSLLVDFFGANWFTSGHEKIKMVGHVLANEKLTFSGVVKDIKEEEDGKHRMYLHVWAKNEKGQMTILGWADALID